MKKLYFVMFALLFVFGGMAAGAAAQDVAPETVEPLAADAPALNPMGTAISYQGQLRNASGPVNGVCDMTFQLFDALSAGTAISTPITTPVTVTNGLFVTALDFGAKAFNGEARWLEISVKCAGDAGFTTLTSRQSIAPAPYALALPGLRTEPNSSRPNVIGGSVSNTVASGVIGAVIGGGSNNVVTGDHNVISGGQGNHTGSNGAQPVYAVVGGGSSNAANGGWSTVSGGTGNLANRNYAVVGGGFNNAAAGHMSTVPGGAFALASHTGEMAFASGRFAATGDAQTSVYVLRNKVAANQTQTELFLDAFTSRLTISNTRTLAFAILIVARSSSGESSGWRYEGVIENNGGATAFIGTPTKTTLGKDDAVWEVDLIADDANDALVIRGLSNQSGDEIRFVATVRTVEVAW